MRWFKKKSVTVVLAGGLGNQLFQYSAGAYLAHHLGVGLTINATLSQFGRTGHNDWMDCFELGDIRIVRTKSPHKMEYLYQLAKLRAQGFFAKASSRLRIDEYWRQNIYFRSKVIGFDPNLEFIKSPLTLSGYFQTYRYSQYLRATGYEHRFVLKDSSDWHTDFVERLTGRRILSLHVRRGDYLKEGESFGILSGDYYQSAIRELRGQGASWDEIWVFSDEPDAALADLSHLTESTIFFVKPPSGTHSAESMDIMSKSTYLIIGNSTFSWWAAFQSEAEIVIRPEKWFRRMEDPELLCPNEWISVRSSWKSL